MTFQEHMEQAGKQIEDLSGAAISDSDGIIVEAYHKDDSIDMALLVAEYGPLWNLADKAGSACHAGIVQELSIVAEKMNLIIRKIAPGYNLIFAMGSQGNLGKGRFYAGIIAQDLMEDLDF